ncbi:MAG: 2-keto-3-deoxy-L-arabinonate dehydratase [Gammaproteobacteria bacterium]|jgi:2-keto-3-deoxy-L-arabinonate dehydratase
MKAGGVIGSDAVRHPLTALDLATEQGLLELVKSLNLVATPWGH